MSESEPEPGGISDDDLPEDLQPGEDNPLAEPLDEEVDPDDLDLHGGKDAEQDDEDGPGGEDDEGPGASGQDDEDD